MRVVFQPIKLGATKSGKCLCGKCLVRSQSFEQTINPFNKNKFGEIKNIEEIMAELKVEAEEWKKEPIRHQCPTYWKWTKEQREQFEKGKAIKLKMICGFYIEKKKV